MSTDERELTLHLDRIEDLFEAPHVDLRRGRLDVEPGVDSMMKELRAHWLPKGVRATIVLPGDVREDATEDDIRKLVGAYATSNMRENENVIAATRREGLEQLVPAIILLFACLSASVFVIHVAVLSKTLAQLLSQGLEIVGWVGMWQPLQALLYDWWPAYRDNRIYRRLMNVDIAVRTEA